ncbi:hypothetical protein DSO57_1029804 [Entomophthora muscae]|uniref:Uncharacterized protein n=1 Tax=Entomophthora muscae TaxID=34485 RepID=A0ACC2U0J4_9FUNG|nr:hypothetical protein DSO57_1029804 [Entomophthora muscae]
MLQQLINSFLKQFVTEEEDIPMANVGKHTLNTGNAKSVAQVAYQLPKHREDLSKQK